MQDPVSEKQTPKKKLVQRVWFWILIGLVLLVVIFFSILPVGVDYGIKRYIKNQGVDQVSLEDVDFNPITGRMTLTNLSAAIGTQTVLHIPEASLNVQWTPFIRKRFVLEGFAVSDIDIVVEQLKDGAWQIGGITIPRQKSSDGPASWGYSFQKATATNCKIQLISSRLKSDVVIEQVKLSTLTSWLHDDTARLEFTGRLNEAPIQLKLDVSPFGNEMVASGQIKLTGLSLNPFAQLLQPHLKTLEGRLDLDLNIETRKASDSGIEYFQNGPVKLHQLYTQMEGINLSKEDLTWNGAVRVNLSKSEEGMKISADGQLNGSKLALNDENENLKLQQDKFSWKGKINYTQDNTGQKIQTDGQVSLMDLKMDSPELNLAEDKLTWKGVFQLPAIPQTERQQIIADGSLESNHLQASLPDRRLKIEHQGLSWKGRLESGETNDFASLEAKGDISLNDIEIFHSKTNQFLLNSDRIELQAIQVESLDKINVSDVVLNGPALLAEPENAPSSGAYSSPLRIQKIKLGNVRLSQRNNLSIDTVQVTGAQALLQRDLQGKWPAIDRWNAIQSDVFPVDQSGMATSGDGTKEKSSTFGFHIGKVVVAGESGLQFMDESVSPKFVADLSIQEAYLSKLDSNQPNEPATVKLLLSDEKNAQLSLHGTLRPFAGQLNLDWVGKIEALELPSLSPYVIDSTGYRFTSGELAADVPLKIDQNKLKGEIDLVLYNPKIKRIETAYSEKQRKGKIQLNMTLPSALKLLRDKRNNVQLNIPISGNINDPQFSVADAINKVLAKTLQTAAISTLKYMLGPYGIGISVAQIAYEQALKIRLNPIQFTPGSDALNDVAIDYLQRVAAILKEYPTARVSVCGVATESDRKAMNKSTSTDTALLALAKKRTDSIEDYLVNLNRIEAKRIIACEPEIDKTVEAKPRADLGI